MKPIIRTQFAISFTFLLMGLGQCVVRAEEPVFWPNRKPYEKVGTYRSLLMPIVVTEAVKPKLGDDPSKWEAYRLTNYAHQHKCVAFVSSDHVYTTYFVTPTAWYKLNTPQSTRYLNEVIGPVLKVADLKDKEKVFSYLDYLFFLELSQGAILDNDLREREFNAKRGSDWLRGTEKRLEVLRALGHDPTITIQGDDITIVYNIMPYAGSVERWTLHAKRGEWLTLTGIERTEIFPEGTFFYPIIQ